METTTKQSSCKYKSLDDLPLILDASDVSAVLNISRSKVYELFHRANFPTLVVDKRMLVPKDKFIKWISDSCAV